MMKVESGSVVEESRPGDVIERSTRVSKVRTGWAVVMSVSSGSFYI